MKWESNILVRTYNEGKKIGWKRWYKRNKMYNFLQFIFLTIHDTCKKKDKLYFKFFVLAILTYSFYLSYNYSTYHIDPWHWGTIASEAIDLYNWV